MMTSSYPEVGGQHQGMDRPGVRQVPEGSGEQGKIEKTGRKIICGAPTTLAVKGLMMMMMMMMMKRTAPLTMMLLSLWMLFTYFKYGLCLVYFYERNKLDVPLHALFFSFFFFSFFLFEPLMVKLNWPVRDE